LRQTGGEIFQWQAKGTEPLASNGQTVGSRQIIITLKKAISSLDAISSGRSVAIAKECIFSSDELRIALLTLILLQGADKLGLGRLSPPFLVSAYRMRSVAHSVQ
jgi:hypothetical protein